MTEHPKLHEQLPAGLSQVQDWVITELSSESEGISVRGRFALSPFQKLDADQLNFLVTFVRCRGILSSVEKELGLSYPTVRSRLDSLLKALGYSSEPDAETEERRKKIAERQQTILEKLESGELTPAEAKEAMKEAAS
ncbi:MAG: DUF2089 domain-containing protein [Fimbriimonadales bacterium]